MSGWTMINPEPGFTLDGPPTEVSNLQKVLGKQCTTKIEQLFPWDVPFPSQEVAPWIVQWLIFLQHTVIGNTLTQPTAKEKH